MSNQKEYRRLKEEVAKLSAQKVSLERQIKDVKALKKQKSDLNNSILKLKEELNSLDS